MKPVDYQKRFAHVENWHLVAATGVVHVGSPERLLIVDESPLYPRYGQNVLYGPRRKLLAELLGFKGRKDLLDNVDVFNLLPRWPGRTKTGKIMFPTRYLAKREWNRFRFEAGGVVLLGRVGKMLGLGPLTEVKTDYPSRAFGLPHSTDPWWNDRDNVVEARKALEPWAEFALTGRWPR